MASLEERLRLMDEAPRRRQRGQVPKAQVAVALQFQREFVHESRAFNTSDISDCAESLEILQNGRREALESRQMMWEDHYATQLHTEETRNATAKQQKLRQETGMLAQLKSDYDKWNMAIELRLLEFIQDSLSVASEDTKRAYFISVNKAGLPPLHRACKMNHMELVKLLLKLGADLTTKDTMQKSVFHLLAEFRLTELFKYLVAMLMEETEEILLGIDGNGTSIMHIAAANGSDGILTELLTDSRRDKMKTLANLVTQDEKRTALHLAALRGHITCVELLLKLAEAKADLLDRRGSNALHLALQQTFDIGKLIAAFLVHTPADQQYETFSKPDEVSGQSCLHTAIIKNFRQVAISLIRSGQVQVNAATRDGGWTPLHLAVITEEIEVINELLATGAMLDAVDADGQTPLLQACLGGQLKLVRLLLNAGANPSHQNKQAHSPLHYLSAFCRDRQLLRDIIANGADVNAKSMKLNTPMHFAAMNGNEVATQVLLEHGASASVINEDKRSVVYLAKKWRHRSVEDLVRPPEDEDDRINIHSSSSHHKPKPSHAMATRQAQLRSMGHHARSTAHSRPRSAVVTTRSENSDSESLYDFEDDELILPPSTPWPISVEKSRLSGSNNDKSKSPTIGSCSSFSELRDRFMGERSPLKPVILAQDRQKALMDMNLGSRTKSENHLPPLSTVMTKFSRRLVVEPVRIPWEMTVPVTSTSNADALSNQRKLKPSIRTNIGLLRDHLAHAPQLHWPRQAGHHVFRKTNSP
ncbi:Ankyrin-1 [Phytophthora citrophthora]|uniref:Ankyrin-1 n=1 Tax=Phytophthora citrophthora TaxID=4793 RepID=A0AAD9GGT2_9STRA|nr:Ankyrin-1 [Phytophthora citrophthora]